MVKTQIRRLLSSAPAAPPPPYPKPAERLLLPALHKCQVLRQIHQVHAQAAKLGAQLSLPTANKILHAYARQEATIELCNFFRLMPELDTISWTVMVGALAKSGDHRGAAAAFRSFLRSSSPSAADCYILPAALRNCAAAGDFFGGTAVHQLAFKLALHSHPFLASSLLVMYSKSGFLSSAQKVFDEMPTRDLVLWTSLINSYTEAGKPTESLALLATMAEERILLDKVAAMATAVTFGKLGVLRHAAALHGHVWRHRWLPLDTALGTAILDMYAKCGDPSTASSIFNSISPKNVLTWSAMISCHASHGACHKALQLFSSMLLHGPEPNSVTFVAVLSACSHGGMINEGIRIFNSMVDPGVKHYTCMVDMMGRAGRLSEAIDTVQSMEVQKDESLWGALLGGCRTYGHGEMGEMVGERLMDMGSKNAGYYALLSNIYAHDERWDDVGVVREMMVGGGVRKKMPGWAWVEIDGMVFWFCAGERDFARAREVDGVLDGLRMMMEDFGYVVDDEDFLDHHK